MYRVFEGRLPLLSSVERFVYRAAGVDPAKEQSWKEYTVSFLLFSLAGTVVLYAILRLQAHLPFYDPKAITTQMSPDLAANTALSFSTTTTWQAYAGETTMSAAAQMFGLCAQNFLAGAAGLAVGIAFMRGLSRQSSETLGNFWVDLTRGLLYVLLPGALVGSTLLILMGSPMNFSPNVVAHTLEGGVQTIAQGPVAALQFISNLGTNGGGYFNANAAHPYETPSNAANLLNLLAIVVLPAALTRTFGLMSGKPRHGWLLLGVMTLMFAAGLWQCHVSEHLPSPAYATAHIVGPNMEGKEQRFGVTGSVLAALTTSNGATGSTDSAHDSYTPIGGTVLLVNMLLGEMIFGGLGTGIYSIVMVAVLAIFLCGLMVGRTPEYLGKRIRAVEMKLLMLYALACPIAVLLLTAVAVVTAPGVAALTTNSGPHAFTEVLFGYTSCFANNGQSFGGLNANSPFYNVTTMISMFAGRFLLAVPALAFAGSMARQIRRPETLGTMPTDGATFGAMLIATAVLVVALSYFPALALGPLAEHFRMAHGLLAK